MRVVQLFLCVCALLLVARVNATPTYRIKTLGLVDAEHVDSNGAIRSTALKLTESGQVAGTSLRMGAGTGGGQSAWLYDGASTLSIGPSGPTYQSTSGQRSATVSDINQAGRVIGNATRYNGLNQHGQGAWVYDGTSTSNIGLYDAEHTRSDGFRSSSVYRIGEGSDVVGYSTRYDGGFDRGRTVWLYDGTTTKNIGLADADHTRADGYRQSTPSGGPNSLGQVVGTSSRFVSPTATGQSVWIYDGTETKNIGLVDADHTRNDGYRTGTIRQLSDNGYVAGESNRFSGMDSKGLSAWIYDGEQTRRVGLTGVGFANLVGYEYSSIGTINNAGVAVGISTRFNENEMVSTGTSTWYYDGMATVEIGLVDDEHTNANGVRGSSIRGLNEGGHAFGFSQRFDGNTAMGYSAWISDGTTTTKIGLFDAPHTSSSGYQESIVSAVNHGGMAIGHAVRYDGGNLYLSRSAWLYDGTTTFSISPSGADYTGGDNRQYSAPGLLTNSGYASGYANRYGEGVSGEDAWVYDPILQQTLPIVLSTRSDGYSHSQVQYLGEDGVALGTYELFNGNSFVGDRLFYFSPTAGAHDLGSLVQGGLEAADWNFLAGSFRRTNFSLNGAGQIIGAGSTETQTTALTAFLLTPVTADFNQDGFINGRDFLVWQRGESPEPFSAEDLALWQSQNGNSNALNANVAVPEPGVESLVLMGICAIGFHRSSRRNSYFPASAAQ